MSTASTLDIIVYQGPRDAARLQEAIAMCTPGAEFAILESLTKTDFPDPKTADIDLTVYPRGRIFNPSFELRWERSDSSDDFRTVLATETDCVWKDKAFSDYFQPEEVIQNEFGKGSGGSVENYKVYLRPEKDASLGRAFEYTCIKGKPEKEKANAMLTIKRYRDAWGRLIFWRYCKMEWEQ